MDILRMIVAVTMLSGTLCSGETSIVHPPVMDHNQDVRFTTRKDRLERDWSTYHETRWLRMWRYNRAASCLLGAFAY